MRSALLLLAATTGLCAQQPITIRPAHWLDPDQSAPLHTQNRLFPSQLAGSEVSYLIYLPPAYETTPAKRYPVLYWLHGLNGDPRTSAFFVRQADEAIRGGRLQPIIVVLVNGMRDCFYNDSPDGKWPVESVIVKELIPHIDKTFRTIARREGRGIEGFSMGGYGAAHLGFKYPELFGFVGVSSGALLRPEAIAGVKWGSPPLFQKMFGGEVKNVLANDPFELLRKNAEAIRGKTAIRVGVGDEDSLKPRNLALHELLAELKIVHTWEIVPGVGHVAPKFYQLLGDRAFSYYQQLLGSL